MSWKKTPLTKVSEIITKGTTPTTLGKQFVSSGIPFLRVQNINGANVILNDELLFIDKSTNQMLSRSIIKSNDVLLSIAGSIGRSAVVPEHLPPLNCNQAIAIIRPKTDNVSPYFLKYWLDTDDAQRQIYGAKVTATISNLSLGQIKQLKMPLPPLAKQKRIAAILDKADAIRRKRQQAIKLVDDFLRATFLDMFGDPVTNPKKWEIRRLGDLSIKIGSGATPRGGKSAYVTQGISLIRSLNIHDDEFKHKKLAHITNKQANGLANVVVEDSDLLLNITGASVCRCAIVPDDILPARVNQHVCIIRSKKTILNSQYLLHCLISKNYKQKLLSIAGAGGATREALTKQQVENIEIPVPPLELQNKYTSIKNCTLNIKNKHLIFLEQPLFKSLAQRAFRGEL